MSSLISVRRQLLPVEHTALRDHMDEINRLGNLGIKWRKLGEAGVSFVGYGQYKRASEKQRAKLGSLASRDVAERLNQTILPAMPHGNGRLEAEVTGIDFVNEGRFLGIAYRLDSPELVAQRKYVTDAIDEMNGINSFWGEFEPHVTVATVGVSDSEDFMLEAFWEFAPLGVTLLAAKAQESQA